MRSISDFLCRLEAAGVRVWIENGELRFRARKGSFAADTIDGIRSHKAEIFDHLRRRPGAAHTEPPLVRRAPGDSVPLTFTQQWYWAHIQSAVAADDLDPRKMRICSEAKRIYGPLDIGALRSSLDALIVRHESLRTRMLVVDGVPVQEVCPPQPFDLEVIDLCKISTTDVQAEAKRLADQFIYQSVGPWFSVRLIKLSHHDHVLIVGMDHVIADAASVAVLSRDLWTSYFQAVRGRPIALPTLLIQFADYAVWQRRSEGWWQREHGGYWKERLANAPGVQFPRDDNSGQAAYANGMYSFIRFGESTSAGLRELSRRECTTLVMSVLTIFAAVFFRWQHKTDWTVKLLIAGRDYPQLQHVIGFLASNLYLRIQLQDDDTFLSLLRRVAHERNVANEHNDHGRLSVVCAHSEFQRCATFNWLPLEQLDQQTGQRGASSPADDTLRIERFRTTPADELNWYFDTNRQTEDPSLMLWDGAEGISGMMCYQSDLFRPDTMERFCGNLRSFAHAVLESPQARIRDFSYA